MSSYNKVLLMGNLTRDPEVRYTPKGSAVTDIGLAVNRAYTLDSGERREEVTFVDVTLWGRQAELAGQYLSKGRPVFIEGRLQLDSWEDKNTGEKRNKLRVVSENMRFIGAKGDGGMPEGGAQGQNGATPGGYQAPPPTAAGPPAAAVAPPSGPPPTAPMPAPVQPAAPIEPAMPQLPPEPGGAVSSDLDDEDDIPF